MTLQRPDETAAAEAAIASAAAEAEANEPANRAPAPPAQPVYGLYPVEWRGDRQEVADESAAEVEPLSLRDVWKVVNLMARMGRDAAPDKEAYERKVRLHSDLLLYGHCYVDAETGERVPPQDVVVRTLYGVPINAKARGREVLDASMAASSTTYENAERWRSATWEWMTGPDGPVTAALAEITADLQTDGVLADDTHLTVDAEVIDLFASRR